MLVQVQEFTNGERKVTVHWSQKNSQYEVYLKARKWGRRTLVHYDESALKAIRFAREFINSDSLI